jgi:RNA 2',3'-cyclic 3'-phosphodiesterase
MRTFIALPLPDALKAALLHLQDDLRSTASGGEISRPVLDPAPFPSDTRGSPREAGLLSAAVTGLGLPLGPRIHREGRLRPGRAETGGEIRWVKPAQMHLTLAFLGEVDPARQSDLSQALQRASQGITPFPLEAASLGFFPEPLRPRVLWAGLRGDCETLVRLQTHVATATAPFAEHQEDRPFSPHLTLARIKRLSPSATRRLAARVAELADCNLGSWTANHLELIHSELHREGSRYTCLAQVTLR